MVEVPQTAQNAVPENKTHVLQQIKGVLDTTEPSKPSKPQETRIEKSNTKDTNPIVTSVEPCSATPVVPLVDISTGPVNDLNKQTKEVPQETIINPRLDKPADLPVEKSQRSVGTHLHTDTVQAKDMVQPMDVDQAACPSDTKEKEDDEKVNAMLEDFVDSD